MPRKRKDKTLILGPAEMVIVLIITVPMSLLLAFIVWEIMEYLL